MDKAVAKAATSSRSVGADARDAFVLLAMSVVAAALGLGLYLQFEAGFVVAVATATAAYLGLVTVHVLVRRARAVVDLQAEIQRLNAQIAQLKRAGQAGRAPEGTVTDRVSSAGSEKAHIADTASPETAAVEADAGSVSMLGYPVLPRQDRPSGRETARAVPPPVPPNAAPASDAAQAASDPQSEGGKDAPEREVPPAPSRDAAATSSGPVPRPAEPSVSGSSTVPPPPPLPRRAQTSPPAVAPPGAAALQSSPPSFAKRTAPAPSPAPQPANLVPPAQDSIRGTDHPWPTAPAKKPPSPAGEMPPRSARLTGPDTVLITPPPTRSSQTPAPVAPSPPKPAPVAETAQRHQAGAPVSSPGAPAANAPAKPRLDAPGLPIQQASPPVGAGHVSHGQTGPASHRSSTPSATPAGQSKEAPGREGREFESMQVLIKQLAAQLNSTESPDLSGRAEPDSGAAEGSRKAAEDPIDQSVAALRETAETMRRADESKPPLRGPAATGPARGGSIAAPSQPERSTPATPSPYGRLAMIAEAIEAERIDVYLDPILALGERRARHFEVSVRLRTDANEEIDAEYYTSIASQTGLLPRIDAAKLARTAVVANRLRARGSGGSLFSTLAGESLADDGFLNAFADVFAKDDGLGSRLVLTFTQDDVRAFSEAHWDAVSTMAEIGLRFSLEGVSDLDMDFERLKKSGFDFVKLDAPVFLEGLPSGSGNVPASDLCRHLSGLGLAVIVGRITDERDLARIMGFGVLFGQGMLFGAPRPVKVDVRPAQAAA